MNVGIILLLLLSIGSLVHSNEFDPEQPIESTNSSFSSEESDSPNDLDLVVRKASTGRKVYQKNPMIWFKFQIQRLLRLNHLGDWPTFGAIMKEQIYFDLNFLRLMQWIHEKDGEYYDMSGNLLEAMRDAAERVRQTFYFEPSLLYPQSKFMMDVLKNPKNDENATMIFWYELYHAMRLRSHDYFTDSKDTVQSFKSFPLREKGENEILVNGTFAELAKLSYNEHFSNLSNTKIWVGRALLDWHWQKPDEMDLFNYKTPYEANENWKKSKLSSEIPWYLDSEEYFMHIGRFRRFPENAWLMFLNVKDENGKFYRPYRVINPVGYQQEENAFYAVPKAKVRQFFNLKKGDNEYLEIFKKVETEKQDANEVWLSDKLLDYLKALSPNRTELRDYREKLKKISYSDMVEQMCKVDESRLTRIITLHIVQDYSVFLDGHRMFQWSFSSQQILRWTCYSLNEDDCMYKTLSVVCRYLKKNHPAKYVKTKKRKELPISW